MLLVSILFMISWSATTDSSLATRFNELAHGRAATAISGNPTILPPTPERSAAVLLVDGTEVARLDSARWVRFQTWQADSSPVAPPTRLFARPSRAQWISWIRPPSGGTFRFGWSQSEAVGAASWTGLEAEASWRQSLGAWFSAGAGYTWEQQTPPWNNLDNTGHHGLLVTACGPVVCWEMRQKALPYPDATIFESELDSIVIRARPGTLIKRLPTSKAAYWQQSLEAHLGALRWKGTFASDAWDGLVQEVSVRDLPAGPLRWGLSLAWAGDRAMTGFSFAAAPWTLGSWTVAGRRQELSWEIARFELLFARIDQARLAVGTVFRLSDPLQAGASR